MCLPACQDKAGEFLLPRLLFSAAHQSVELRLKKACVTGSGRVEASWTAHDTLSQMQPRRLHPYRAAFFLALTLPCAARCTAFSAC
jgi:hypothetical protein